MTADNPWDSAANAEEYDHFVRTAGIYRHLARDLAVRARVADAHRVLDIACGTGAATEACLAVLPPDGEVIAFDASAPMVAVAQTQIDDPRVRFAVAPAADVARVCEAPVDRAVCSAALWHFPAFRPVLAGLAQVLDPGDGIFAFNLSAAMVKAARTSVHPFQVALTRHLELAGGHQPAEVLLQVDLDQLDEVLVEEGFEPAERSELAYRCPQREMMDLMEVPALIEPLAPALPEARRVAAVRDARRHADPDQRVEIRWIALRTRLR